MGVRVEDGGGKVAFDPAFASRYPFSGWGLRVARAYRMDERLTYYASHPEVLARIGVALTPPPQSEGEDAGEGEHEGGVGGVAGGGGVRGGRRGGGGFVPPPSAEFDVAAYLVFIRFISEAELPTGLRGAAAHRFASWVAWRAERSMLRERREVLAVLLDEAGLRGGTWSAGGRDGGWVYSVPLKAYFEACRGFEAAPRVKLVDLPLSGGVLHLSGRILARLTADLFFRRMVDMMRDKWLVSEKRPGLFPEVEAVVKGAAASSVLPEPAAVGVHPTLFPPCIDAYVRRVEGGGEVGHFDSFLYASFMSALGAGKEEVLTLLSRASNYRKNVAEYQVAHVYGEIGGGTKYTPPGCDAVKLAGLCPVQGYCEGARSPLTAYLKRVKKEGERGRP